MDAVLFKAAAEGDIGPFENYQTCLDQLLTPDENTILHVYLGNQSREPESTDFVDKILEMCPQLLLQANKKGEIPLHLAARYGHSNVVKVLIDRAKARPTDPESGVTEAKKMLRMTNEEQDTALHEAARNRRSHVVEILTKEDRPELSYSANVHGETPLYIAASSWGQEQEKVIDEILANCISVLDYGGPNGRTALHAASAVGDHERLVTHYAAFFSTWLNISVVKVLLEYDASAAYIAETEKKRTALHIAAIQGHVNAMKEIVSRCPACCELVDNRGWNALHYVVASKRTEVFKECLRIPLLDRLKTKKDNKGNTPFHLIAALALKLDNWLLVFRFTEEGIYGLNKQKLSIKDIYNGRLAEIQEILESLEDVGSGPFGCRRRIVLEETNEKNKKEKDASNKA
ncbi:PREDICTED: ankyrin-3-like [Populus euphratica]|uniref:Ankyrin-3-like n=1 Tax=Populus euphratica TaxID=75702 RepID=A0AAJ6TM52_POPEU|nr:PREDICTED: ankyrin-3-like [Populus euphratica]